MRTWTAAAISCLLASSPASGLDSTLRLTQYRHTAWRVQDGSFPAAANAIAQTTAGYIWIGTERAWSSTTARGSLRGRLPVNRRRSVLSCFRSWVLWIGTATGSLKNDTLGEHVRGHINAIIEGRHHRIWVARSRPPDPDGGFVLGGRRAGSGGSRSRNPVTDRFVERRSPAR
jgi:hypothetical protein